jgi:hypothetical protein
MSSERTIAFLASGEPIVIEPGDKLTITYLGDTRAPRVHLVRQDGTRQLLANAVVART